MVCGERCRAAPGGMVCSAFCTLCSLGASRVGVAHVLVVCNPLGEMLLGAEAFLAPTGLANACLAVARIAPIAALKWQQLYLVLGCAIHCSSISSACGGFSSVCTSVPDILPLLDGSGIQCFMSPG